MSERYLVNKRYLDPREHEMVLAELLNYHVVPSLAPKVILKNMKGYLQVILPMKNKKGHDTFDVYLYEDGHMARVEGHRSNTGFSGVRTFRRGRQRAKAGRKGCVNA